MTRPEAPTAASIPTPASPARNRGAGRWCVLPATALFALPVAAYAAPEPAPGPLPGPAPDPVPPQIASPPSTPPLPGPGASPHAAMPGQPVAIAYPTLSADDELILEVRTQHREMTDTLTAHGLRGGVYLPMSDIARFLDLPISVSDDGHYANGWYLSPLRTVSINLRAGTITLAGKESAVNKADFAAYDGELWVKAERLSDILPIRLTTDLRSQSVVVKTLEPFPFEQKADRENARARLGNAGGHGAAPVFERQDTPYLLIDAPISEVELRTSGAQGIKTHFEGDLRADGDFLFMTARTFASVSSSTGLIAARVELGRRDPEAHLLGPLRATEFEMGDVATTSMPIGLRGVSGRGFALTNEPIERASVFETMDFRGDLQSGFEVELYRNDSLVASTRDAINGRYEFLKVPVEFGLNVFRLVFYGPQGQRREDVRRVSVGDGRLAKGVFTYNLFAVQKDKSVINVTPPQFVPPYDYGAAREGFAMQYGLTSAVTIVGSGALYRSGGAQRWLGSAGIRTGLGGWAAKFDAAIGSGGATALELGLAGRLLGATIVAVHANYSHGFVDEMRSPARLALTSMTEFDLTKTLHIGQHTMPLSFSWQHLAYADGQTTDTASFRQTVTVGRVLAANVINYTDTASRGSPATHLTTGTFDLTTFAGSHTQYRGELGYTLGAHPHVTSISAEVDRDISATTSVRASLTRTFNQSLATVEQTTVAQAQITQTTVAQILAAQAAAGQTLASQTIGQTTIGLSATHKFGPIALSFDSTYTAPSRNYAFTLRLGFSFGRNPLNGHMFVARPGLSSSGAVAVRAFDDMNGDDHRDPDEAMIGKVGYFTGSQHVTSNAAGDAVMTGIGDGARTVVRIDGATLPDIAMAPSRPGVELIARPGRIPIVQFAIQRLSDIEGTAVYANGRNKRGVAGLVLYLINARGHRVARVRSESDGFVLMEQIRPGDYTLAIAPDQAKRLKIRLASDHHVKVGHHGKLIRLKIVVAPE